MFVLGGCTEMVPIRPADVPSRGAYLDIAMTDGTRLAVAGGKPRGDRICGALRACDGPQCEGAKRGIDTCVVPEAVASMRQERARPEAQVGGALLGAGVGLALGALLIYGITSPFRGMTGANYAY